MLQTGPDVAVKLSVRVQVKVKLSHYRSVQALIVLGGRDSHISRQLAHECGKVVSPTHRPPLSPGNTPGTHFYYRPGQTQGHIADGRIMSMNNSNEIIGS